MIPTFFIGAELKQLLVLLRFRHFDPYSILVYFMASSSVIACFVLQLQGLAIRLKSLA